MINEFLKQVCNTPCTIIAYDEYGENGGPEVLFEVACKVNFQRTNKREFKDGMLNDILEGSLYVPVEYIKTSFQSGKVIINGNTYNIKSITESYGINGNVEFYVIKTE